MSQGTLGVLLLVAVVVVASFLMHRVIGHYWIANLVAAALGTTILHVVSYISLGYSDPFDVVSIPFSFLVGLGISAFVGTAWRDITRSRERRRLSNSSDEET